MKTLEDIVIVTTATLMLIATIGCDENENQRLAEMAERHVQRQAEQSRRTTELQQEVAAGSRRLVEADAETRREIVALQRELQSEVAEVGRQRDLLEQERRELAAARRLDPIIAAAINGVCLLLACALPLVLCWYLLQQPTDSTDAQAVADLLLEDLGSESPQLVQPVEDVRRIGVSPSRPDTAGDE